MYITSYNLLYYVGSHTSASSKLAAFTYAVDPAETNVVCDAASSSDETGKPDVVRSIRSLTEPFRSLFSPFRSSFRSLLLSCLCKKHHHRAVIEIKWGKKSQLESNNMCLFRLLTVFIDSD